jgi:putative endonuclease
MPASGFQHWRFWRRWFGVRSERAAARFLQRLGYRILATNQADRRGELDLIALDGQTIVIVEVRSRLDPDPVRIAQTVDYRKQRKLTEAAVRYLSRRRLLGQAVRFDVVAISWPESQQEPTILHFPDAFEAVGRFQMFH